MTFVSKVETQEERRYRQSLQGALRKKKRRLRDEKREAQMIEDGVIDIRTIPCDSRCKFETRAHICDQDIPYDLVDMLDNGEIRAASV